MNQVNQPTFLEDLRKFRWELYHHRNSRETLKCLSRYYFKKYYFEHFAEEIVISGYDLQNLNWDIRMDVHLHIPHLMIKECPSIRKRDDRLWDLNRLFICLVYENKVAFIEGLKLVAEKRPNDLCKLFVCSGYLIWQLETWLKPSVKETLYQAIEELQLMSNVIAPSLADVFKNYRSRFDHGKSKRYKNIVEVIDAIMPEPKFRHKKEIEHFDRDECLEILIDWDPSVTKQLHNNQTILYHAINRNNHKAIAKLLKKGVFIGNETDLRDCNILDLKVLKKHFDSCITKCVDDDRFIEIDIKNLIAPRRECRICDGTCSDEMKAIELISNSKDHRKLLNHPLISTFVHLKWNRLAIIFYIDFFLYTLFALSTIGYILAIEQRVARYVKITLTVIMVILTIYIAGRRILQQVFGFYGKPSVRNRAINYLKCFNTIAIVICVISLLLTASSSSSRTILATICILLIACELFTLAGSIFWSFSKYYIMFLKVTMSSIKSLQLCIILIPTFSLAFYLLLRNRTLSVYNNYNDYQYLSSYLPYYSGNSFDHIRTSFIKTLAMSSNEFDATSSNFDANIMASILFLGFLFLLSTVFMNLLIGIAVCEVQKIQSDAEATSLIQRIGVLAQYEGVKLYRKHWIRQKFSDTCIMRIIEYFTKINSLEALSHPTNTKIYIAPHNKMFILRKDYKTAEQYSTQFDQNGSYLNSWLSYFSCVNRPLYVDPRIVHHARQILDTEDAIRLENFAQSENKHFKNRIVRMENDLQQIKDILKHQEGNITKKLKGICNEMNRGKYYLNNVHWK